MNTTNFNAVTISKEDYFSLPADWRAQSNNGPLVLSMVKGRATFVRANIIEPNVW